MGDKIMADGSTLQPAAAIAQKNRSRQPNESAEYRKAREALLVAEIELNRHIARVAAQRRALPPGGEVKGDYQFMGEASSVAGANPVSFEVLFGDKDNLFVSWDSRENVSRLEAGVPIRKIGVSSSFAVNYMN